MAMDKLSTTGHAQNMSYPHLSTAIHKRKKKKKKVAKKKKKKVFSIKLPSGKPYSPLITDGL
jgi:hypothetical protein